MRYSTTAVVAALSIGQTLAGPTHAHLHRHRNVHEKKDVNWNDLDWENMGVDWTSAWAAGQHSKTASPPAYATPVASPIIAAEVKPTKAAAAPSSPATDLVSDVESTVSTLFSHIKGLANDLTAFGSPTKPSGTIIGKVGNIGSPQGSNMILVSSAKGYQFTNTFINTSPKAMTIVVWNKAYDRDGTGNPEANLGSCLAATSPALSFTLAPGKQQVVAFQEDTQAGWAEATTAIAQSGAYATTWGEINYLSAGSGYDVSAIMNEDGNDYDMSISCAEVECVSDMTQNLWIGRNNNPEDPIPIGNSDGSCFIPGSTATIITKMGGKV